MTWVKANTPREDLDKTQHDTVKNCCRAMYTDHLVRNPLQDSNTWPRKLSYRAPLLFPWTYHHISLLSSSSRRYDDESCIPHMLT